MVSGKPDEGRRGQMSQVLLIEIKRNEILIINNLDFSVPWRFWWKCENLISLCLRGKVMERVDIENFENKMGSEMGSTIVGAFLFI